MLRGETELGSTFLEVLARYAEALRRHGSQLMLSGVAPSVQMQLERTGQLHALGRENICIADDRVGQALQEAMDAAERWIAAQPEILAALE